MLIEFRSADRMLGLKAIGVYRKGIEAASAALDKVFVSSMELQTADADALKTESWVAGSLEDFGVGETRDVEIPTFLAVSLRTACSCYLTQLGKLVDKQAELLVPPDNTNEVISHLQSLADRLAGQIEMRGTIGRTDVEITFGDKTVKTTMEDMERAAHRMATH